KSFRGAHLSGSGRGRAERGAAGAVNCPSAPAGEARRPGRGGLRRPGQEPARRNAGRPVRAGQRVRMLIGMTIPLTGTQFEIEAGGYRATVTELGGGLRG